MITSHGTATVLTVTEGTGSGAEVGAACRLGGRATPDLHFVILNNKQTMIFYNSLKLTDKPKNEVNFEEFLLKK